MTAADRRGRPLRRCADEVMPMWPEGLLVSELKRSGTSKYNWRRGGLARYDG